MSDQISSQSWKVKDGLTLGLSSDSNKVKKTEFTALELKLQGENEVLMKAVKELEQKANWAKELAKSAREIADKTKKMTETIFTEKLGIQQGSQVVSAYSTKEGATIKVENPEYEDRIRNLEQVRESDKEEMEELKDQNRQLEDQVEKLAAKVSSSRSRLFS